MQAGQLRPEPWCGLHQPDHTQVTFRAQVAAGNITMEEVIDTIKVKEHRGKKELFFVMKWTLMGYDMIMGLSGL